jgi:DNA-binding CsgD family transcriptional regulator
VQTEVLSPRQVDVLLLVARGRTDAEISKRLGLPRWTVEMYRQLGMDSIGATTRADEIGWALCGGRFIS